MTEPRYTQEDLDRIGVLPERRRKPGDALPRGAEAQCPRCSTILANDATADDHQYWTGKGDHAKLTCLSPEGQGLVPDNRGDRVVWCTPAGLASVNRTRAQTAERRSPRRVGTPQ